jgi:VanZ family protein
MSLSKSVSTSSRWLPLLAWILVIFFFSTDRFAGGETSRFIIPALHWLFPSFSPEQLALGHAICRKAGHVLEFFVLGLLAWRAFQTEDVREWRSWISSAALVLFVALLDEFHQSFVPSRTSSITDVGYDFAGGLMALLLISRFRNETRTLPSYPIL